MWSRWKILGSKRMKPIEHKHLIVRAEVKYPPGKKDIDFLSHWFQNIIERLGMKLLSGPHIKYVDVVGNKGLTGVCIIETSHIAMHVWEELDPKLIQLDVYTCGSLDPQIVFDFLQSFYPSKIEYKYLDREHGLNVLENGVK
jgi:S-adenosylmethionine/arginine decarboxylase-like enzyme